MNSGIRGDAKTVDSIATHEASKTFFFPHLDETGPDAVVGSFAGCFARLGRARRGRGGGGGGLGLNLHNDFQSFKGGDDGTGSCTRCSSGEEVSYEESMVRPVRLGVVGVVAVVVCVVAGEGAAGSDGGLGRLGSSAKLSEYFCSSDFCGRERIG